MPVSTPTRNHGRKTWESYSCIWDHRTFWPVKHSCNLCNMQLFYPLLNIRKGPTRCSQSIINGRKNQKKSLLTHKNILNWIWPVRMSSFYLTVIWFSSNKQEIDTLRMPARTATMKYDLLCDHGQEHFHVCLSSL